MAGTQIKQTWQIADGRVGLAILTSKPLDGPAFTSLVELIDAIETFVYANQPKEPFVKDRQV